MTAACSECGCTWLPCARKGVCVTPLEFWRWMLRHPLEYRSEHRKAIERAEALDEP